MQVGGADDRQRHPAGRAGHIRHWALHGSDGPRQQNGNDDERRPADHRGAQCWHSHGMSIPLQSICTRCSRVRATPRGRRRRSGRCHTPCSKTGPRSRRQRKTGAGSTGIAVFEIPSAAVRTIAKRRVNGWRFWRYRNPEGNGCHSGTSDDDSVARQMARAQIADALGEPLEPDLAVVAPGAS